MRTHSAPGGLAKISKAQLALDAAKSVAEVKTIHDQVAAISEYFARHGKNLSDQNAAAVLRLKAARKLGQLIPEQFPQGGWDNRNGKKRPSSRDARLEDLGITYSQSSRWQTMAKLPEEAFEGLIKQTISECEELTNFLVIQAARQFLAGSQNRRISAKQSPVPKGRYGVLVVDPPWPVVKIKRQVRENQVESLDYPTMTVEDIVGCKNFPKAIDDVAAADCHLFLWTTQKHLLNAFTCLGAWAFEYGFVMVWHKPGGFQPVGQPQYNCEFVVYGRRGSPGFVSTKDFPVCFEAPRGRHSEKPDRFYEIVRRVTEGKRLDIFNRRSIPGFDGCGKEAK